MLKLRQMGAARVAFIVLVQKAFRRQRSRKQATRILMAFRRHRRLGGLQKPPGPPVVQRQGFLDVMRAAAARMLGTGPGAAADGQGGAPGAWDTSPVFRACVAADIAAVRRIAAVNPNALRHRDDSTATPLHFCMLRARIRPEHRRIAEWIVQHHPERALDQYRCAAYEGQVPLHIAIVHRDRELVAALLRAAPGAVLCRARGRFFSAANGAAFGEWPLLFAAATNQPDVVLDVLHAAFRALGRPRAGMLDQRDAAGNTVFHMAALHGHVEMWDYLVELAEVVPRPACFAGGLHNCTNAEGLTPLALAAARGPAPSFAAMLDRSCVKKWEWGPYSVREVRLDEFLDRPAAAGGPPRPGVLSLLVTAGDAAKLDTPLVQQVLEAKWKRLFAGLFFERLSVVCGYAALFLAANLAPWGSPWRAAAGPVALALLRAADLAVLGGAWWKGRQEAAELRRSGLRSYFGGTGAGLAENVTAAGHCGATVAAYACRAGFIAAGAAALDVASHVLLSVGALFLTGYIVWLLIGWERTGPFVIMMGKMCAGDVQRFGIIFVVFTVGFVQAQHILFRDAAPADFATRLRLSAQFVLLGDDDLDSFTAPAAHSAAFVSVLLRVHVIFATLILLNLLVAMMSSTYNDVWENAGREWLLERARIMASMEAEMPDRVPFEVRDIGGERRPVFVLPAVTREDIAAYHGGGAPDYAAARERAEALRAELQDATLPAPDIISQFVDGSTAGRPGSDAARALGGRRRSCAALGREHVPDGEGPGSPVVDPDGSAALLSLPTFHARDRTRSLETRGWVYGGGAG